MSKKDTWKLNFDSPDLIFSGGDNITGKVVYSKGDFDLNCVEVRLDVIGLAVVDFKKTDKVYDISNFSHSGDSEVVETIFYTTSILDTLKDEKNDRGGAKEKNIIEYPFSIRLALELPGSIIVTRGHIRYEVLVLASYGKKLDNSVTEAASTHITQLATNNRNLVVVSNKIQIIAGLDLSFLPEAAAKLDVSKFRELGFFCFDGTVLLKWHVDISGYVGGDIIVITETIDNESQRPITNQNITLYKTTSYTHLRKKMKDREIVACAQLSSFVLNESISTRILHIALPMNLQPSGLGRCRIIDISYDLEFSAEVIGPFGVSSKIKETKEIYIGTIPLNLTHLASYVSAVHNQPNLPSKFSNSNIPTDNLPIYQLNPDEDVLYKNGDICGDRPPPYVPNVYNFDLRNEPDHAVGV